jgi:histidyl-tRNA synthetase|tara:strand:+ start:49 stop:1317 length:1269 start_codon:yes stop_codon:yes gene_type:complete
MSKIGTVRGMNDLPPKQVKIWIYAESIIRKVFDSYGYEEIRFPLIESTELFVRSNESADIVTKEMYSFEDKGGDSISLRPEGTAGCVRAAIDNDLLRIDNPRLWYNGPMFRYERPQKGRSRQFHQSSVEAFGIPSIDIDAEIILLSARLWKELEIDQAIYLEINNIGDEEVRKKYVESLIAFIEPIKDKLDEDSLKKFIKNPLRILDSKSKDIQDLLKDAPKINDFLDDSSKKEFQHLQEILKASKIDFRVNSSLVRGLDYYNKTVFEWKTDTLGSQNTVCGGGRYDKLIEDLGGKPCPAVGFSIGMERLIAIIQSITPELDNEDAYLDAYFICLGEDSKFQALMYSERIRDKFPNFYIKINMGQDGPKSQFKKADRSGAKYALILGEKELEEGKITVKDLIERTEQITIEFEELLEILKTK